MKDVNAKECAPEMRLLEVIAEGTETDIAQSRSVKRANLILYDYLRGNCTFDQIMMLSRVLMDIASGYGRTKELGQRMHARIQDLSGGGTYQQERQHGPQIHPSLPKNATGTGD